MPLFSRLLSKPSSPDASTKVPSKASPLSNFSYPAEGARMEDHIMRERNYTEPFPYIAITSQQRETKKEQLHRLLASHLRVETKEQSLNDIKPIVLIDRELTFNAVIIPGGKKKFPEEFVRVVEILAFYTPTQSVTHSFSKLTIALCDGRMVGKKEIQTVTANNNFGVDARFSMDYSVHSSDAHKIYLKVNLLGSVLASGTVWGSLVLAVRLEWTDRAQCAAKEDVLGVLSSPDTPFRKRNTNPDHLDLTLDDADRKELTRMMKEGRIIDHSKPVDEQTRLRYSQSEAGSSDADRDEGGIQNWRQAVDVEEDDNDKSSSTTSDYAPPQRNATPPITSVATVAVALPSALKSTRSSGGQVSFAPAPEIIDNGASYLVSAAPMTRVSSSP